MPIPAKRIQLLLPVPLSEPKRTSATSNTRLMAQSSFHCSARRSASINVSSTNAMSPRISEKTWTITHLTELSTQPEASMAMVAIRTM